MFGTSSNGEQTSVRVEKYIVALVKHPNNVETVGVQDNSSEDIDSVSILDNSSSIMVIPPHANVDENNTNADDLLKKLNLHQ